MYSVNVASTAAKSPEERWAYVVATGNEGVSGDDPQFQEYARYVMHALDATGSYQHPEGFDADVAVVVAYGVGNPEEHRYSRSIPVFGQTGVSSHWNYTYGHPVYKPKYGITGYRTEVDVQATYLRYIVLYALDLRAYNSTNELVPLWKTTITSRGSSKDLRKVFPAMIAAAIPYIGTNTARQVSLSIREDDSRVVEVKRSTVGIVGVKKNAIVR
jgi:hypothetical protein